MKKLISDEEYYTNLPNKHIGACVLIFNKNQQILIIKPTYKEGWAIPGGGVEYNESPEKAARREAEEELGLDLKNLTLIGVGYTTIKGIKPETLQLVFYGGELENDEVDKIVLDKNEHSEFRFVDISDAKSLLDERQSSWLAFYDKAPEKQSVGYLEL